MCLLFTFSLTLFSEFKNIKRAAPRETLLFLKRKKDADQLRGLRVADQSAFVFATKIIQYIYFLNPKFPVSLAIFSDYAARFVSDLVGNPEDRLSCIAAQKLQRSQLFTAIKYIVGLVIEFI